MYWAIGLYYFIGFLAACGGYDKSDYDRQWNWWLTLFFWPLQISVKR